MSWEKIIKEPKFHDEKNVNETLAAQMKEELRALSNMNFEERFAYINEKEFKRMLPFPVREGSLKAKEFGELMGRTAKEYLDSEEEKLQ
tara:strand:+ start:10055 stop:10321 length:267 start_codon:yes stop_codon:yes gene_type:complete